MADFAHDPSADRLLCPVVAGYVPGVDSDMRQHRFLPSREELPYSPCQRREAAIKADHHKRVLTFRGALRVGLTNCAELFRGRTKRFLNEDRLALAEGFQQVRCVTVVPCEDKNRVDVRVRQQGMWCQRPAKAHCFPSRFGPYAGGRGNGFERYPIRLLKAGKNDATCKRARSDGADPQGRSGTRLGRGDRLGGGKRRRDRGERIAD